LLAHERNLGRQPVQIKVGLRSLHGRWHGQGFGKDQSQVAARDLGLAIANEEWITSADDDDWLYPQSIDKRLHAIHAQPGARWSAGY
jgi:hypothetical protein